MNKLYILCFSVLIGTFTGLGHAASESKVSKSVIYYADPANQAETHKVLEECKSQIKTVFDYEIVMSHENCKNAQIGEIAAYRKQQRDKIKQQADASSTGQDTHIAHGE